MIPVGYLTKLAMDVEVGNILEGYGKVIEVSLQSNILLEDEEGEEYFGDGIRITTPSYVEGECLDYVFNFYEEVNILQYALVE
jgi:hypothetical protein